MQLWQALAAALLCALLPAAAAALLELPMEPTSLASVESSQQKRRAVRSPSQLIAAGAAAGLAARDLPHSGGAELLVRDLTNVNDIVYTVTLGLGTPSQPAKVIVDTGSSDLWVSPRAYTPGSSKSANQCKPRASMLVYGTGQVLGDEVCDRACIADMCVANQSFVAATQLRGISPGNVLGDESSHIDGIVGLAFPGLLMEAGAGGVTTFVQALAKASHMASLSFGLILGAEHAHSSLILGELSEVMAAAEGATGRAGVELPVLSPSSGSALYWMVPGLVGGILAPMALDSGTTLVVAPLQAIPLVFDQIMDMADFQRCFLLKDVPFVNCPCDVALRPLQFDFVGMNDHAKHSVQLDAEDLFVPSYEQDGTDYCYLNIQFAPDERMQFWILGTLFLRKVYTVFDVPHQRAYLYPGLHHPAGIASFSSSPDSPPEQQPSSWHLWRWALAATAVALISFLVWRPFVRRGRRRQASNLDLLLNVDAAYQKL